MAEADPENVAPEEGEEEEEEEEYEVERIIRYLLIVCLVLLHW